ncbi:MAG: hypothetical protein HN675_03040 [Opitutae bacterium]|nr:hypothetical protein [Opitutae bacterium]MBT5381124.1 hypothetical protein [Opitutae bacterium]MBT5690526.1 hypothetical protein [Opitutae bacterium]MBT7852272.1 hypothetical protein [Opitutae bacterium]
MLYNFLKRYSFPLFLLFLMVGCQTPSLKDFSFSNKKDPIPLKPVNFFSVEFLPADFAKVAVLPVHQKLESSVEVSFVDGTLINELNGKGRLEAVPVSKDALVELTGESSLSSTDPLPPDLLARLRSKYGADGVLLTDITHYYPYKPISIGLRCKLADASTGEILWSADTVYNSGNQEIQVAALNFQKKKSGSPFPLEDSGSILQSPRYFTRFVASTVLDTLPRR